MRKALWIIPLFLACGCVTKGTYLSELGKRQVVEKQSHDLGARLESEIAQRQAAEASVADLTERKATLETALATEKAARAQETSRADRVQGERDTLRADLATERAARGREETRAAQLLAERDRLASSLTSEQGGRTEEAKRAALLQAERDGLTAALASEKAARGEEAARASRLQGELDLQGAARARAEQDARGLQQRVAALEGQVSALGQDKKRAEEEQRRAEEEKQRKLEETTRQYEGLLAAMKGEVAKGEITISNLKGRLTVNMLDEILFDSGSAKIKPKGMEVLRRVGDALKDVADKAVVIEGHTDNVALKEKLKEKYPTNWELSTARATSVVRYFQDDVGLDPLRLSAVGFGEYRPVDTNETPEGKQRNRRIEIKLVPLEAPLFGLPPKEGPEPAPTQPSNPQ